MMVEYPQTILIFTLHLHFVINYLKVCLETQDTICTSRKQLRHKNLSVFEDQVIPNYELLLYVLISGKEMENWWQLFPSRANS